MLQCLSVLCEKCIPILVFRPEYVLGQTLPAMFLEFFFFFSQGLWGMSFTGITWYFMAQILTIVWPVVQGYLQRTHLLVHGSDTYYSLACSPGVYPKDSSSISWLIYLLQSGLQSRGTSKGLIQYFMAQILTIVWPVVQGYLQRSHLVFHGSNTYYSLACSPEVPPKDSSSISWLK